MRYRMYFVNGESITISEDRYISLVKAEDVDPMKFFEKDWPYIAIQHVTHIIPEDQLENATSGVVTAPSVNEVKRKQKEEHEKKLSSSPALVQGIREKSMDHGEE